MFEYNLRFPGQQFDAVVGLHYNYFRDYDPAVGRYVESDPIGLEGGLNLYDYAGLNPILRSDATGEYWKVIVEGCKIIWRWISKPKIKKKPDLPDPKRLEQCQTAFLACLRTASIQESLCFQAHTTCVTTKTPMIFPGYGPIR